MRRHTPTAGPSALFVRFHKGGGALVTAGSFGPVQVWNGPFDGAAAGEASAPVTLQEEGDASIAGVEFVGEDAVAAVTQAGTATLWNLRTGKHLLSHEFGRQALRTAISPDGRFLAFGGQILDLSAGRELPGEDAPARQVALQFSADGGRLLSAGFHESLIVLRDLPGGKVRRWRAPSKVKAAALNDRGDLVAAVVAGGDVILWRVPACSPGDGSWTELAPLRILEQEKPVASWRGPEDARSVTFGAEGAAFVVVDGEGLTAYPVAVDGERFRAMSSGPVQSSAIDGHFVALGTTAGVAELWDVARRTAVARTQLPTKSPARATDLLASHHLVVIAAESKELAIFRWK